MRKENCWLRSSSSVCMLSRCANKVWTQRQRTMTCRQKDSLQSIKESKLTLYVSLKLRISLETKLFFSVSISKPSRFCCRKTHREKLERMNTIQFIQTSTLWTMVFILDNNVWNNEKSNNFPQHNYSFWQYSNKISHERECFMFSEFW